jgi:plastocyanin
VYYADRMMRSIWITGTLALVACGGTGVARDDAAAAADTAAVAGTVHEVRMLLSEGGDYVYQPAELTIRPGDRVRWVNVSGGPHNVAFYADRIPAGALEVLNAAMPERLGGQDLVGKLLMEDGAAYEISFAGAPEGTYAYLCTPHEMMGMQATLTVAR